MSGTQSSVDASIPLQAKAPASVNPLQTIGEFANVQNALNQNRLFPGALAQQGITTQGMQNNLVQQSLRNGYAALAPLLASGKNIGISDIAPLAGAAENAGVVTQPLLADIASVPITGDPATDNAALRARIAARLQLPENAAAAVSQQAGPMINQGGVIQPTITAPAGMPGAGVPVAAGGAIPITPTASERNQLVPVWDQQSQQFHLQPRANVAPMANGAGQPTGSGAVQPMGSEVPGLPPTARPQPPGAPSIGAASSAPLGTPEAVGASVQALASAHTKAADYQNTIFPIQGAITSLQGADTGKGGEVLNSIRGYLGDTPLRYVASFLPATLSDQDKRVIYDEANKFTTGMALNAPGGARSNQGNEAATAASPSVHISNAAALAISQSVLAQRRMEQATTLAFDKSGQPQGNYLNWAPSFVTRLDPRAFAMDMMSGPARGALVKSLGGVGSPAYQRLKDSYQTGVSTGVLPPPGGG